MKTKALLITSILFMLPTLNLCMVSDDNPAKSSDSTTTVTRQASFVEGDTKTITLSSLTLNVTVNSVGGTQAFINVNDESMIISLGNVIESQETAGLSVEIVSITEKAKAIGSVVVLKFSYIDTDGSSSDDDNGGDIGGGTGGNETSSSSSSSSS